MKKILLTTLAAVLIFGANFGFSNTQDFKDVTSSYWAKSYIDALRSSEIINGYPDGTFKPQANVKVNEFITMTIKALGYRFESISSDWSKPYVDKAIELKIIQDKEFQNYNAQINREQMTSIVVNALSLSEYRPSSTMDLYIRNETTDYYLVGDYYKQNVLDSYKFGIVTGYSDKTFRPKGFSTRAEASAVLSKLLNKDLRTPFVKTDARYAMMSVSTLDEFGENLEIEQALYAPLLNGKPVNEIIDMAEIFKTSAKQEGKGFLTVGSMQLSNGFGITGYQSKEYYAEILNYEGFERAMAYAQRADFTFYVGLDDLSNKFNPYHLGLNKKFSHAINDPLFSTYFFRTYEAQLKPIFQYLFGSDFDRAWSILKTSLDHKGEPKMIEEILNNRVLNVSYTMESINLTISLKK